MSLPGLGLFWIWNCLIFTAGLTGFISKVLTVVNEKFLPFCLGSKKIHGLYHTNIDKIYFCLLGSSFELENAPIFPAGQTSFISKVITDIHQKFWSFYFGISRLKKYMAYSTRKSIKSTYTFFVARLNLKMHHFSWRDEMVPFIMS